MADGTIGKTIAIKRYKLKIGLRELARELQISPSYLVGIEHDERLPAARLAERIEKRLGIPRLVDRIRDAVIARWEAGSRG